MGKAVGNQLQKKEIFISEHTRTTRNAGMDDMYGPMAAPTKANSQKTLSTTLLI